MAKQTSRERRAEKRAQEAKLIAEMDEAMAELGAEKSKTDEAYPQSASQEKKKREVKYTYQPMDENTVKKTRLILGIVCVAVFVAWLVVKSVKG